MVCLTILAINAVIMGYAIDLGICGIIMQNLYLYESALP